jgi:hypothetical protein
VPPAPRVAHILSNREHLERILAPHAPVKEKYLHLNCH